MHPADTFYLSDNDPPSKREILRAALKLFARDGVAGTNIRAIASESGYSNPALFKYFESKDSLALYLFERCYWQCFSVLSSALAQKNSYPDKLHMMVAAFAEFIQAQPEAFFFVQENLRTFWPTMSAASKKHSLFGEFRKLLQQGRDEGSVDAGLAIDIQLAALMGFFFQLARMNHFKELASGVAARTDEIEAMIVKMFQI